MKIVLRDLRTGRYFAGRRIWVARLGAAAIYSTVEEAAAVASESGGQDVAVVLRYEEPECELALNPAYCVTGAGAGG